MLKKLLILIFFAYIFTACGSEIKIDTEYKSQIESWKETRINNLTKPDSWLSLTGLFWLEMGDNSFGTDKSNDLVFPKGLPYMGTFTLNDTAVIFRQKEAGLITVDEEIRNEQILKSDLTGEPTLLKYASLTFYLIERDGKMGIRVKDSESEVLRNFDGLTYFPIDPSWRIEANFEPYDPPKKIIIPNIIGTATEEESPGKLVFTKNEEKYFLDVLPAGENYFIIFADKTSGEETYGAGRFLYVTAADSSGKTIIDFNKAYNPPCAFTKYATCPLPPKDNYLKLAVEAGEKKFH